MDRRFLLLRVSLLAALCISGPATADFASEVFSAFNLGSFFEDASRDAAAKSKYLEDVLKLIQQRDCDGRPYAKYNMDSYFRFEDDPRSDKPVKYFSEAEIQKYKASVASDGSLHVGGEKLAPGKHLTVMSTEGDIYIIPQNKMPQGVTIRHSSLSAGGPVAFAGHISIAEGGNKITIHNDSGHYLPDAESMAQLYHALKKKGAKLGSVVVFEVTFAPRYGRPPSTSFTYVDSTAGAPPATCAVAKPPAVVDPLKSGRTSGTGPTIPTQLKQLPSNSMPVAPVANKAPAASSFYAAVPMAALTIAAMSNHLNATASRMNQSPNLEEMKHWLSAKGLARYAEAPAYCQEKLVEQLEQQGGASLVIGKLAEYFERQNNFAMRQKMIWAVDYYFDSGVTAIASIPGDGLRPDPPRARAILEEMAMHYCYLNYVASLAETPGCAELSSRNYGRFLLVTLKARENLGGWENIYGVLDLDTGEMFGSARENDAQAKSFGKFDPSRPEGPFQVLVRFRYDPNLLASLTDARSEAFIPYYLQPSDGALAAKLMHLRKHCGVVTQMPVEPARVPTGAVAVNDRCLDSLRIAQNLLVKFENANSCQEMASAGSLFHNLNAISQFLTEAKPSCDETEARKAAFQPMLERYNRVARVYEATRQGGTNALKESFCRNLATAIATKDDF